MWIRTQIASLDEQAKKCAFLLSLSSQNHRTDELEEQMRPLEVSSLAPSLLDISVVV